MANHQNDAQLSRYLDNEELIAFAESSLAETAEKQRAALDGGASLPFGFGSQPGDTLDLSDRGVRDLPIELINLIKDRVERLSLGHNRLTQVPAEIVLHLRNLQILDLSHNNISSIPDTVKSMFSLMFLAVEQNQIRRLPVCIGEMSRLTKIKVGSNPIEFPPPDIFVPSSYGSSPGGAPVEEARQICSQVKSYLREVALKEQSEGSETLSESNLETPRPPKRTVSGRFPVRPSISGIDGLEHLRITSEHSLMPPPPIPQKSRARDSIVVPSLSRRPGIGALIADGDRNSRSRSDTVTSIHRSKRLGYVPRKISNAASISATESGTLKPLHYRGPSHSSLAAYSGNESSSGAVSPVEGPVNRHPLVRRRLSSLPEDRRVSRPTTMTVKLATRVVFTLFQLNPSIGDAVRIIKSGTPKKMAIERYFFEANSQLEELDRRLSQLAQNTKDNKASEHDPWIQAIRRKLTSRGELMYVRNIMLHIFGTMVEVRNILTFQAAEVYQVKTPVKSARSSMAANSSRSVTPTQAKPFPKKRLRGATILQPSKLTTPGSVPPPVPLSTSRSNTMTSMSATPKSGDSFASLGAIPMSRSNTQPGQAEDSEEQRQFEQIYIKLQNACDLAAATLPGCRVDFFSRKEGAHRSMQTSKARHWTLVLHKCDASINALEQLRMRLSLVKLKDPGLRNQRDFWQLCDIFVRTWTDLAVEIKNVGQQGYDTDSIKVAMRPVLKAVKDVGLTISASPLYQNALRSNTASGYVTPVPATPLSAALGPAALATVPSTPSSLVNPAEYFPPGQMPYAFPSLGSREDLASTRESGTMRFHPNSRVR
ncbi:hypothetical protein MBLNU459_g6191t1 [Dothideomycetes sp. NU459]